ncbi:AAA family ATPase, partial [Micromonospora sp. ATA32]|nr:AAA family ATPase [Micromonospora sp. ATA32]
MELLERADALGSLDDLLAASASGGRIALVSGEAGAGKSALVSAFMAAVGPRARVLQGSCDPLLTPRALGPLHDIARQVGGALAERLAALAAHGRREPERRGRVFDALLDELDGPPRRPRPVVVIEDAHWADEATLDLTTFLGRRLGRCRALLVLTYRDDEVGPGHPLHTVLAGLPRPLVRRLPLPPLSTTAVETLARRAGRSPAGLYQATGGNPLLVTEVLAAAEPGVPPTVRDLVLARLAALSHAAREVAGLVSVVPSRAGSYLLDGEPASAVDECLARGVLVPAGNGVMFRHELLGRAVSESARRGTGQRGGRVPGAGRAGARRERGDVPARAA